MPKKKMQIKGKENVEKYIDSLSIDEQVDAFNVLKCLRNGEFDQIHCKTWEGKIKEVYFKKHNRIFYIMKGDTIHLLHACKKKRSKTTTKDSSIVRKKAKGI